LGAVDSLKLIDEFIVSVKVSGGREPQRVGFTKPAGKL
jgi:hypothetical protein